MTDGQTDRQTDGHTDEIAVDSTELAMRALRPAVKNENGPTSTELELSPSKYSIYIHNVTVDLRCAEYMTTT